MMERQIILFKASDQHLQKTGGISTYASDTISYVYAIFALGNNWDGFDSVKAIWSKDGNYIATVLNHDGECEVPSELLEDIGPIEVNLVGSVAENGVLVERLTSFPTKALDVIVKVKTDGGETQPITPSQFEQFVEIVKEDADRAEAGATDSEAWAIGERNGEEVGDTDPTYHNNSKYYSHRAEQQANTAGYMEVEIDANGHLMYYRTDRVDADFYLDAVGHLILESVV